MTWEERNLEIGNRIRAMREDKNLTQEKLADALEFKSTEHVSRLENGKHSLTLKRIIQLHELFGVSADYIIWGENPPRNDVSALADRLSRLEPEYLQELEKIIDSYLRTIHLAEKRGLHADDKDAERNPPQ